MSTPSATIVDVHTHLYPPSYIDLLSSRTTVPYIHKPSDNSDPRLIILPSDDDPSRPPSQRGRPIDKSYSSWTEKLSFMAKHNISISVVSLANPWLDFLPSSTALSTAQQINDDLNEACRDHHSSLSESVIPSDPTLSPSPSPSPSPSSSSPSPPPSKLYAFGCLPLSASSQDIVAEIHRLKSLPYVKGVIMGTTGLGDGLDDPALESIWEALASTQTLVFLHPHYGLPDITLGGQQTISKSGHVLPLALGFPIETTIAVTRMFLAGVFDRHADLQMLLAHSGGTLPFLAGRIQSCVEHEREFVANGGDKPGPQRDIWDVLKTNIYLDAVIYGKAGLKAAIEAGGIDRVMFGTDHPFFPPLKSEDGGQAEKWLSVLSNGIAIDTATDGHEESIKKILGGNAARVLNIKL